MATLPVWDGATPPPPSPPTSTRGGPARAKCSCCKRLLLHTPSSQSISWPVVFSPPRPCPQGLATLPVMDLGWGCVRHAPCTSCGCPFVPLLLVLPFPERTAYPPTHPPHTNTHRWKSSPRATSLCGAIEFFFPRRVGVPSLIPPRTTPQPPCSSSRSSRGREEEEDNKRRAGEGSERPRRPAFSQAPRAEEGERRARSQRWRTRRRRRGWWLGGSQDGAAAAWGRRSCAWPWSCSLARPRPAPL